MIPNTPPCDAVDEVYENYVKGAYFCQADMTGLWENL